jgi:hypothetical protein
MIHLYAVLTLAALIGGALVAALSQMVWPL